MPPAATCVKRVFSKVLRKEERSHEKIVKNSRRSARH
jgi:hypothetical protein